MAYLSVDDILNADDLPTGDVDVPEWGGVVKIQGLSKAKQIRFRNDCRNEDGTLDESKLELTMFVASVIEPQFAVEDIPKLQEKSANAFDRISLAINELNGETKEAADESADTFHESSEV